MQARLERANLQQNHLHPGLRKLNCRSTFIDRPAQSETTQGDCDLRAEGRSGGIGPRFKVRHLGDGKAELFQNACFALRLP